MTPSVRGVGVWVARASLWQETADTGAMLTHADINQPDQTSGDRPEAQGQPMQDMAQLLQVEDDVRLTEMLCPGTDMLLWPMVRTPFLRLILSDLLYSTPIPTTAASGGRKDRALGLAEAVAHNTLHSGLKGRVLIRASVMGGDRVDGKRYHRLVDGFVSRAADQTVVLEDLMGTRVPRNRWNAQVWYHDPILALANIRGRRAANGHAETADALIAIVEERARACLGWTLPEDQRAWFKSLVVRYIARAPTLMRAYRRLLKRLGTEVLIAEEACYGNAMVCLVAAAKSLGIKTAEFQHGMVSKGHDAYVLAPTLAQSSAYKAMLPDYFLGYGEWWNTQLGVPVEPVIIGNPDATKKQEQVRSMPRAEDRDRRILVLGDGIESVKYTEFATTLAAALPQYKVIFRPHPLERGHFASTYPNNRFDAVEIDHNPSIYQSLADSHAVIGEVSTGLFEAMGLADRIFLWATEKSRVFVPEHPFETFGDVTELATALTSPRPSALLEWSAEDIWASGWQARYDRFLEEMLSK
ncbi:MAG: hypothetical protein AB3N23_21630 [Paracoccaceae bacterium]